MVVLLQLITSIDTLLLAKVHHLTLGFLLFVLRSSVGFDKCKNVIYPLFVYICMRICVFESTDLLFNLSYSQCSFSLTYIFTSLFLVSFCISDLLSGILFFFFFKSEIHLLEFHKCGPVSDCLSFLSASNVYF